MDRKIVKPAQDGGRIWNPEHGRFLPAEGVELQMTPYWLGLEQRGDIVASDVPAPEMAKTAAPAPAKAPASVAPTA